MFPPGFGVDVRDAAKLHVAALAAEGVKGERVWAYGWEKRWTDLIGRLRGLYPGHEFPGRLGNLF